MREVTVFYAYDDREFFDREECLAYECEALDCLKEINEKYSFFDKDMNLFSAPLDSNDVEDWMDWFDKAADTCEFIHRKMDLTVLAECFIDNEWGYCVCNSDFDHQTGWFKYNIRMMEWVKVDA